MKLWNNFTTPEQSKRLLELGVPADSADCYLLKNRLTKRYEYIQVINNQDDLNFLNEDSIPCWSVGRLIEIYAITRDVDLIEFDVYANNPCILKEVLERIENNIDKLDFQKIK